MLLDAGLSVQMCMGNMDPRARLQEVAGSGPNQVGSASNWVADGWRLPGLQGPS